MKFTKIFLISLFSFFLFFISINSVSAGSGIGIVTVDVLPPACTVGPVDYTKCSDENVSCSFSGDANVAYGCNTSFNYQDATDSIWCSNGTFGDPAPGVIKACFYKTNIIPTVTVPTVTNLACNTATLNANVTSAGFPATVTGRGFYWGLASNPTSGGSSGSGTGIYSLNITGLSPSTLYWIFSYAINATGSSYSTQDTFTTPACNIAPTVTTSTSTLITKTSATLGANVTSLGIPASISARGIKYGTISGSLTFTAPTVGTTTGVYTKSVTGLTCGTKYYYQGYATNTTGTGYSTESNFTTSACNVPPTVSAGADKTITLPTTSFTVPSGWASATDSDGTITNLDWSFRFGSSTPTALLNKTTLTPTFEGMTVGCSSSCWYVFRLTATDNDGLSAYDEMTIFVLPTPTYTITFNGNSSTGGSTGTQTFNEGETKNLTANGFTKINYTFAGWNTNSSGTGINYADGVSYTMETSNVVLYAKWIQDIYTVTGTAGSGGTISPSSRTVNSGSATTFTVTPNTGYSASASGCNGSLSGTTYTTGAITANCTVTASFSIKLLPDLIGSSITPTNTTIGVSTNLYTTIINQGSASTVSGFNFFFQIADSIDGTGVITNTGAYYSSALGSGSSSSRYNPQTFTSVGPYSMRVCVDKTNPSNLGTITESDESNNCGNWTNITVLAPDLIASNPTPNPATATVGLYKTFTSSISNIGNISTGTSFYNLFQVASSSSGGGTIVDLPKSSITALANGSSRSVYKSYIFNSSGTYSVRACADKSSSTNTGMITESNEGNNCSSWTNVVVTQTYTVTGTAGSGGTISPSSRTVNSGSNTTFTVTPNTGYSASASGCNGSLSGTTYTTGAITADCTVTASFIANTYTITSSTGIGGTVTPIGVTTKTSGSSQTYSITPSSNSYSINSVLVDGISKGAISSYTFSNITSNHIISATFKLMTGSFTGGNNCIIYSGSTCSNINLDWSTTNPIGTSAVTVNYPSFNTTVLSANSYSNKDYSVPEGNTVFYLYNNNVLLDTITVKATLGTYTVTGTAGSGGSISPSTQSVVSGSTTTLTVTPNTGYTASASGCNGSLVGTTYTTGAITANCTVTASFSAITISVSATTPYNVNPSTTVPFAYVANTSTGSVQCRLLNYISTAITSYSTTNPINYTAPGIAGSFSYYIQCRNTIYTTVIKTSNQIIVNVNAKPIVNAGSNRSTTLPISSTTDSGSYATDSDGTIISKQWTFRSGPKTPIIFNSTTTYPTFGSMTTVGTYVFRFTATDNDGLSAYDEMTVTVNPVVPISVTLSASPSSMTLPTNSTTLSWTTTGSPKNCTATTVDWIGTSTPVPSGSVLRTGMIATTYNFGITCSKAGTTDASDSIIVIVNPEPNSPPTAPTITAVSPFYKNVNQNFTFVSTDPESDQVRYEIDWDNNGTTDSYLPSSSTYINSGNPGIYMPYFWSTIGNHTLKAKVKDDHGNYSPWSSFKVNVVEQPLPPFITFNLNLSSVDYNGVVDLTWSVDNATSCFLSSSPSFVFPVINTFGTIVTSPLTTDTTFTLSCLGTEIVTKDVNILVGDINPIFEEK